jgi:hypothetical protein
VLWNSSVRIPSMSMKTFSIGTGLMLETVVLQHLASAHDWYSSLCSNSFESVILRTFPGLCSRSL